MRRACVNMAALRRVLESHQNRCLQHRRGWSRDVSEDIANEVLERVFDADENLSEDTKRFISPAAVSVISRAGSEESIRSRLQRRQFQAALDTPTWRASNAFRIEWMREHYRASRSRAVLNRRSGLTGESERVAFAAAARILWVVDGSGTVHSEAPSLGGCI
jgi:hypothetical protein